MSRKPDYYATKKNNYMNRLDIEADSVKAKESGVSYGKYKAGMRADDNVSDYTSFSEGFVRRTEKETEDSKPVAAIRIR